MTNFGQLQKMLKTAQDMQERLQKEMEELRIEGSSGGGMVTVIMNGRKSLLSIRIDPEVVNKNDVDMLQDLILAAIHDAAAKVEEQLGQKMGSLGAGLKIPGLF